MTVLALPRHLSPPPEEAAGALEALVREAVATGTPRQALLLRLSRLPRAMPHHVRLAVEALEPLTAADRARLFLLPNGDAAVVWRGAAPTLLAEAQTRLATLFGGLESEETTPPGRTAALAQHLGLPEQADLLLAAATASIQPAAPAEPPAPRSPLDPATLATLEEALGSADLSRFARRRPVCALVPGEGLKLAWENRVLSLTELAETLVPGFDLEAAPWLFRRLSRILDLRMMALLAAPQELDRARPFALRLNIASILSPAFLRFDAALPSRLRGRVVIALRPEDVLADPPAFLFARGFAHARGFRLLLGGLTQLLAPAFPVEPGGYDHMELAWDPVLEGTTLARLGLPAERVMLSGVDGAEALDWARGQGVALVTGRLAKPA